MRASRSTPRAIPLLPLVVAALFEISGALMLEAGSRFADMTWARARPFALAGGVAIQVAFFLERMRVRRQADPPIVVGRSLVAQATASLLILLAGVGLVAIGYLSSRYGWWPLGANLVVSVLAVLGALAFNFRWGEAETMILHASSGELQFGLIQIREALPERPDGSFRTHA